MCNLYSVQASADDVARHFDVVTPVGVEVPPRRSGAARVWWCARREAGASFNRSAGAFPG